jgi:hypothetical protein
VYTLEGQDQSFHTFLNLLIEDPSLRTNPAGPIEVNFELGPHREPRTVAGIPIYLDDERFTVVPPQVSAKVLVPITFEGDLGPELFFATVVLDDWDPETSTARLTPEVDFAEPIDPALMIDEVQPAQITVRRKRNE